MTAAGVDNSTFVIVTLKRKEYDSGEREKERY
jgi:hypothetical protein